MNCITHCYWPDVCKGDGFCWQQEKAVIHAQRALTRRRTPFVSAAGVPPHSRGKTGASGLRSSR